MEELRKNLSQDREKRAFEGTSNVFFIYIYVTDRSCRDRHHKWRQILNTTYWFADL